MAKSISKKFLIAFAATIAALSLVLSVGVSVGHQAYAVGYPSYVTEYDSTHTYTSDDLNDIVGYVSGEVEELYDKLDNVGLSIDDVHGLDSVVSEAEAEISDASSDYNGLAQKYLSGDTGLNGIKGIAEQAYTFYEYYLKADGEFFQNERANYSTSNWNSIIAKAEEYFNGFKIDNFSSYSAAAAEEYYDGFAAKIAEYTEKQEELVNYINDRIDEATALYNEYHSAKYDADKVDEVVTAQDFQDAKDAISASDSQTEANAAFSEFRAKFSGMPTYMEIRRDEISDLWEQLRKMPDDDSVQNALRDDAAMSALEKCESALAYYAALDESLHDLRDNTAASTILTLYKNIAKDAIEIKKKGHIGNYGKVAEATIGKNKAIAYDLIDSLNTQGKLNSPYTYTRGEGAAQTSIVLMAAETVTVDNGSKIVQAFDDSYDTPGTLRNGSDVSEKPIEKISTVTYDGDEFKITVTSYSADGAVVVTDFDSDAELEVRKGTTPAVTRNINTMLAKDNLKDHVADIANKDAITEQLKGKHIHQYFTLTVFEGGVVREEFSANYKVTIEFKKDDTVAEYKDKFNVINYYHTTIIGAIAEDEITMGENNVMEFFTENFTQFAVLSDKPWTDWGMWALIGFIAVIALILIITLIVWLIKNRKFTIVFNANGGRSTKYVKVKHTEKFSYPKNPVRKGYVFMGWYTTRKCETRFASTELLERKRITVYAKWITEEEYAALVAQGEAENKPFAYAPVGEEKNPKVEKLETERLEYEAKKAEEERKAEEIRLLTVQQIEESKNNEEARLQAEKEAEDAKAKLEAALAEQDELINKAREEEKNKYLEELRVAEENARLEAEEAERKTAEAEEARKAAEDEAESARRRADEEQRRREESEAELARLAAGAAESEAESAVEEVPGVEEGKLNVEETFDNLKSEIYSFEKANDLPYGLEENVPACAMRVDGDTIILEVNLDLAEMQTKGYNVTAGEKLPTKFVIAAEEDYAEAEEIVEETMYENGLKRTDKAVITAATDETREQGFEYGITSERKAETAEEFFKLLRVYAKSYVLADEIEGEDKALLKMFVANGRVYMYVNYAAEGLNESDEEMQAEGYRSFIVVRDAEECKAAMSVISAMMKENGLVRYPVDANIAEEGSDKGFTYTLKH